MKKRSVSLVSGLLGSIRMLLRYDETMALNCATDAICGIIVL